MKRSFAVWQFLGFVFTSLAGTVLHFLYDWTDQSVAVGLFSAVNESIWEHMKLLYFPMLIFALVQYRAFAGSVECFWFIKLCGFLAGLLTIPTLYYTYTGALGVSADWFNIIIFYIAAAMAFITETRLFKKEKRCFIGEWAAFAAVCVIGSAFIVFTFAPPHIPLFQDPLNGSYGITE